MRYWLIFLLLFTTPLFADTLKSKSAIKKHLEEKGFYTERHKEKVILEKIGNEWVVTDKRKKIKQVK